MTRSIYSLSYHSDNFTVGGRCAFRMTSGDHVIGVIFGTVLAIGSQRAPYFDRIEEGAVVAWDAYQYDPIGYPATVGFSPFWNRRLTACDHGAQVDVGGSRRSAGSESNASERAL